MPEAERACGVRSVLRMYIGSVTVKNSWCFRQASASFVHRGSEPEIQPGAIENVTLLVGINGSGKTSILRAIALGALMPILSESGYRPHHLVRVPKVGGRELPEGEILLDAILDVDEREALSQRAAVGVRADHLESSLRIIRRNDYDVFSRRSLTAKAASTSVSAFAQFEFAAIPRKFEGVTPKLITAAVDEYYKDYSPSFFLLGYAANRRVDEPGRSAVAAADRSRSRRYLRVAGLFEEGVTLSPFASWLPQIRRSIRYKEVVRLLNRTLPTDTRFTGQFHKDQQPVFTHDGVELPFPALSDGYRAYIGLVGDMLCHLSECCSKGRPLTDLTGVVMVDDIDFHLHPQSQRVVVPRLARAFPKLQFILTTHSPLVVGTVHAANVRVIGKHQVHEFSERLHGLSVDQILSSPYFNYTKPRTDESERQLQALLEGPIDKGDAEPALEFLKELAGRGPRRSRAR